MAHEASLFRPTEEDTSFLEGQPSAPNQNLLQVSPEERQTLFQNIRAGITDEPQELAQPPELGFGDRLGLAIAGGLNPDFRRGVVTPLIEERRSLAERSQTFSLKQKEDQRRRSLEVIGLLSEQEKRTAEAERTKVLDRLAVAAEARLAASTRARIGEMKARAKKLFADAESAGLTDTSLPQKRQIDAILGELGKLRNPITLQFNDKIKGPKREQELMRQLEQLQNRFESAISSQLGLAPIETRTTEDDFFSFAQ